MAESLILASGSPRRRELLSALAGRGVACSGVDLDAGMVAEARAAGLDVAEGDAVAHLRALPEESLGSIIAVHVAEHLPLLMRAAGEVSADWARWQARPHVELARPGA